MDWSVAIEKNREALKRVLAMLVAMAGLGGLSSPLAGEDGSAWRGKAEPLAEPGEGYFSGSRATLPRHLHRAVLRLLRPAESAARRLVIAAARGMVVELPPPRKFKPKPMAMEPLLRRFGIAVVVPPADLTHDAPILPRLRGRGTVLSLSKDGGGGGETQPSPVRAPCFPLFDPLRRPFRNRRRYVPAHAAPRILFPGVTEPFSLPPPPSPDDPIDAARLSLRLAALAAALDDLPGQAKRFARWKAARDAARKAPAPGRFRRISPLKPGRPPGGRLTRYDPTATHPRKIREVDEILAHAHALAVYALEASDTS
jgi:hypothetical protein